MHVSTALRVSIWIVALVVSYSLLPVYEAIDVLLLFCAAGVVPGTGVVLTPGQTLAVLGAVGAAGMLLIFRREVRRAFASTPKVPSGASHPTPMLPPTRQPAKRPPFAFLRDKPKTHIRPAAPKPVVIITIPGRPGLVPRAWHTVRAGVPLCAASVWRWGKFSGAVAAFYIEAFMSRLRVSANRAAVAAARIVGIRARQARRLGSLYLHLFVLFGHRYGRKALPYLERFDRAIETRYKRSAVSRAAARVGREVRYIVLHWRGQLNDLVARLSSKG